MALSNMDTALAEYDGKIVLVTGGLGFIGSNLVHRLAACTSAEIRVVDSLDPACGGNIDHLDGIARPVDVHVFDIRNHQCLREMVRDVDVIFNLAGRISHVDSMIDPILDLQANAEAHLSLLDTCRALNPTARIVYSSTRQCYGRPTSLPVSEGHLVSPVDVNGIDKHAGESYHRLYQEVYGMETCALRLTNTYGPRQFMRNARLGFIGWFFHRLLCGQEILVFGDGVQLRDLTYIDCVVDALLKAGTSPKAPGKVFNLGSGVPISLLKLVEMMIEVFGRGSYRLADFPADRRRIDIGSYYADISLIRSELDWHPRVDLREGLIRTFEFYKNHANLA
jgi:UDP-glucose 4-epimerase